LLAAALPVTADPKAVMDNEKYEKDQTGLVTVQVMEKEVLALVNRL